MSKNNPYIHILQKVGVLKNFTVAKIINKKELDDLKKLVRSVAKDNAEYEKILAEEMEKLSNMHDEKNPIPGIIYAKGKEMDFRALALNITKKFCRGVRNQDFTTQEMAFLITAIINELGLTKQDFLSLKEELEGGRDEDDDFDGEPEDSSGGEAPPAF